MNAGLEQRLVDVQIAEARDDLLRHQQRLDRALAFLEQRLEPWQGQLQRIGAEPARDLLRRVD
jgi:hypothetical protein